MSNEIQNDDFIFEQILKRSATDAEFRARLVNDPASAIEETIGVPLSTLPRPINVKFIEKAAGVDAVLVLPDFVEAGSLSDAELEAVAGGVEAIAAVDECSLTCVCTGCCVTEL
jgi:hypothetical protein